MPARKTKPISSPTDQEKLENLFSMTFPHLTKDQVTALVYLFQLNKGKSFSEYKEAMKIILNLPDVSDYLKFKDYLVPKKKIVARKVGRPVSKITTDKYFQAELLRIGRAYTEYLFETIENSNYDIVKEINGFWVPKSYKPYYEYPFNSFIKFANKQTNPINNIEINKDDFNIGAWWGIMLMINIVLPAMLDRVPELWSVRKHVTRKINVIEAKEIYLSQQMGFTDEMKEEFVRGQIKQLPGDQVKKIRKSRFSEKDIAKFTRNVRSLQRPSPESVAKKMEISIDQVMALYKESKKRNKGISLENTNIGRIFVTS